MCGCASSTDYGREGRRDQNCTTGAISGKDLWTDRGATHELTMQVDECSKKIGVLRKQKSGVFGPVRYLFAGRDYAATCCITACRNLFFSTSLTACLIVFSSSPAGRCCTLPARNNHVFQRVLDGQAPLLRAGGCTRRPLSLNDPCLLLVWAAHWCFFTRSAGPDTSTSVHVRWRPSDTRCAPSWLTLSFFFL